MIGNYKSPIELDYAYVTNAIFQIADAPDFNQSSYELEIGRPEPKPKVETNAEARTKELVYQLLIKFSVSNSKTGEPLLTTSLTVTGKVSVKQELVKENRAEEVDRWMEANAVSLLYSKAKAYAEYLTAMSPLGLYTLPTIDPYAYIDGIEEKIEV